MTNCVLAAIGVDMSLSDDAGHGYQVPPSGPMALTDLVNYADRGFVASTVGAVRAGLATAGPRARGFVVFEGAGERPAHVVNAIRTGDAVVLADGQNGWLLNPPDEVPVLFVPLDDEIRVDGVPVDELGGRVASGAGFELESRTALGFTYEATAEEIWNLGPLVTGPGVKIVIDWYRAWIAEVVSEPTAVMPAEKNKVAMRTAIDSARIALTALTAGKGKTIEQAFHGIEGFVVQPAATGVGIIGDADEGRVPPLFPHYTVGVPLSEVTDLLGLAFANVPLEFVVTTPGPNSTMRSSSDSAGQRFTATRASPLLALMKRR